MTQADFDLLKDVLSIPTHTRMEIRMVNFLLDYFTEKGYQVITDKMNNIYVTKGELQENEFYPCIMAHTDTVHMLNNINVTEVFGKRPPTFGKIFNDDVDRLLLTAFNNDGMPTGIGGDDKCGVYVCLRLLEELDVCKAAFFVSEETGCWGSREASPEFFENVGYAIQFDAPGNHLVTEFCSGVQLFERTGDFFKIASETLANHGEWLYQSHPYTDIKEIKRKFPVSCLNLSCGYYQMHSPHEFVDVEDVENSVLTGKDIITNLGKNKYEYIYVAPPPPPPMDWEKFRKNWDERRKKFMKKGKSDDDNFFFFTDEDFPFLDDDFPLLS